MLFAVTPAELFEALDAGVSDLSELYTETLGRIDSQEGSRAKIGRQVLGWLSFTKRPLTMGELSHAIGLQNSGRECSSKQMPVAETILGSCYGLITHDCQSGQVRLLHYTLLEFLERQAAFAVNDLIILECCLKCLSSSELGQLSFAVAPRLSILAGTHMRVLRALPLILYAVQYWTAHVLKEIEDHECLLTYLECGENVMIWQVLLTFHNPDIQKLISRKIPSFDGSPKTVVLGIKLALAMHWNGTVSALLSKRSIETVWLAETLLTAIKDGSEECTEDLLKRGASASYIGTDGCSLLYHAAANHFSASISLLINWGADVNQWSLKAGTPLHGCFVREVPQKSSPRLYKVVRLLLEHKVEVDVQDENGDTALHLAMQANVSEEIFKLFANSRASIGIANCRGDSIAEYLVKTADRVHLLEYFLERQLRIDPKTHDYSKALRTASKRGYRKVVQILVDAGVDVNAQGERYGSALQAASDNGHEKVVQILVDAGANVNTQGERYGNALQAASSNGHEKVVRILIDAGADVDFHTIGAALSKGCKRVVQILVDAGANANAQGGCYGKVLLAAAASGKKKAVQMLVDAGANVNAQKEWYSKALRAASTRGYEKVVQILVDAGADVNAQRGRYGSALQAASDNGHEKVVQILVDAGANVNAQGGRYGNALQAASYNGHKKVVRILIEAGANVNARGGLHGNALRAASTRGWSTPELMCRSAPPFWS
ncbi:hypothetical protein H2198_003244 [Neophaeococcomyces mojaviensis]|uniref:Uncharacterized protein n=1 Tax=Neophaeococcomyces mojaviensis TaxID=3383035 RepID=A0ACC3ABW2_9EURO|nr:hypothetical protein H2198_003244 [Knufia sp. JES_112]